jgi:NAD+--asparagine ADP-ribosyltransferase
MSSTCFVLPPIENSIAVSNSSSSSSSNNNNNKKKKKKKKKKNPRVRLQEDSCVYSYGMYVWRASV